VAEGPHDMKIRARGRLSGLKLLALPDDYRLIEKDQDDGCQGDVQRPPAQGPGEQGPAG
jgi:hypothetical protein